ncbi:MAG: hypothetical protein KFB93_05720 [Simkaniaceae bacterium]|nr:MAG: hypothetical protein KFB93_05720 [Simkaniaceae bacterium]
MEKQQPMARENLTYYQAAMQFPTDAKNYLGRQVEALQGYGNTAYEYGAQTMAQISKFPARAKAFYNVIDQTAYGSYRGFMLGGLIGFFTGGMIGAYAGAQTGAQIGAWVGLYNGINELAELVEQQAAAGKV